MKDILIIAGSDNNNLKLAEKFQIEISTQENVSSEIINLVALELPLYTSQEEKNGMPEKITEMIPMLEQAKGYIFIAPEYNGGIPPAVTNFISWTSRAGGKDWRKCFNKKAAAIASFSGSGGIQLMAALRIQLSYIGLDVIGRQLQATFSKDADPSSIEAITERLIERIK